MTVAYDAHSTASNNNGTTTSWTHTPVGTPKGVIVFFRTTNAAASDVVTGVTYGGVAMSEVTGSPNLGPNSALDSASLHCFFLGSSIPTGAQTVTVTHSNPSFAYTNFGNAISVTGSADTEVQDSDGTINSTSQSDPSVTLSLGSKSCFCAIGFSSGQGAVSGITPLSGWTSRDEDDHGAFTSGIYTYDTVGTTDVTAGWTQTADDANAIAIAITEAAGGGAFSSALDSVAWSRSVTAVALERGREIVPASVSWARTVTDVTFTKGKTVAPDTVAWARSVQAVSFEHGWEIVPASVSWARSVTDVALEKGYEIAPATVSWARSLDAVLLELGREIVPEGVAWARSVTDVTFTLLADKAIVPDTVAWSRSVQDAALEQGREIIPDTVAWSRGVTDVALEAGYEIVPDPVAWARDIDDITFTYVPGVAVVEVVDTHDGGAAPRKRRNNFQPLPSLEEVRRRLLSRTKRPVDEIEEAAEQIEALAEQIDAPAAPWANPVPLPERSDAAKTLALLAQEARRIQSVLEHVQSVARQRALERYRESVRVLEAAMRERQEAEEADEIVQIIAQIM